MKKQTIKAKKPKAIKTAEKANSFKPGKHNTLIAVIVAVVCFYVIAGLSVVGIGSVFVHNDFAMTLVFSQDLTKANRIVTESMQKLADSRYLQFKFEWEGEAPINIKNVLEIKAIRYDNNEIGFIAIGSSFSQENPQMNIQYEGYYDAAAKKLYRKQIFNEATIKSKLTEMSAHTAINSLLQPLYYAHPNFQFFKTTSATQANPSNFTSFSSSFTYNSKPLYIGQTLSYNYNNTESEQFVFDHYGTLRQHFYSANYYFDPSGPKIIYKHTYLSINQVFTLNYPADLSSYA